MKKVGTHLDEDLHPLTASIGEEPSDLDEEIAITLGEARQNTRNWLAAMIQRVEKARKGNHTFKVNDSAKPRSAKDNKRQSQLKIKLLGSKTFSQFLEERARFFDSEITFAIAYLLCKQKDENRNNPTISKYLKGSTLIEITELELAALEEALAKTNEEMGRVGLKIDGQINRANQEKMYCVKISPRKTAQVLKRREELAEAHKTKT